MLLAVDFSETKPFPCPALPGVVFRLRPLATSQNDYALDRSYRTTAEGVKEFDSRTFYGWMFRFSLEAIEGLEIAAKPDEKIPELLTRITIGLDTYPCLASWWYDRLGPEAVLQGGQAALVWNTLTEEEKKISRSARGGADPPGTTGRGIAPGAGPSSGNATGTTGHGGVNAEN